jgi:predicted small secreted protein
MKAISQAQAVAAALAVLSLTLVSACQTIRGAGKDISTAGEAVADTAEDVEEDLKND